MQHIKILVVVTVELSPHNLFENLRIYYKYILSSNVLVLKTASLHVVYITLIFIIVYMLQLEIKAPSVIFGNITNIASYH